MADEGTAVAEESFVNDVTETTAAAPAAAATGGGDAAAGAAPDELKTAMAELAKNVNALAQPKAEPTKTLSQDEINELWAVYNPEKSNPDFFKKWMRLAADMDPNEAQTTIAERKALFLEMQQGLMRQAMTGSKNLMQIELAKLREELTPMQEYVSGAKAEATRGRFFKEYGSLDDPKYSGVIDATARLLADKTFPDEKTYFQALAEGAASSIKGLVPDFDLKKPATKTTAVTSPRLPRTSAGGTGGTAAAAATVNSGKVTDDDSGTLDWMK